ncbi:MAG: hypothetical protein FWD76_03295, partial [Firmicutes bacterium]|nr:hypothetical protein [Bacillota bacterium]
MIIKTRSIHSGLTTQANAREIMDVAFEIENTERQQAARNEHSMFMREHRKTGVFHNDLGVANRSFDTQKNPLARMHATMQQGNTLYNETLRPRNPHRGAPQLGQYGKSSTPYQNSLMLHTPRTET